MTFMTEHNIKVEGNMSAVMCQGSALAAWEIHLALTRFPDCGTTVCHHRDHLSVKQAQKSKDEQAKPWAAGLGKSKFLVPCLMLQATRSSTVWCASAWRIWHLTPVGGLWGHWLSYWSLGAQILTLPGCSVLPIMGLSPGLSTPWKSMKGKRGV